MVGYRQKIKKTNYVGQAIADFGLNISFKSNESIQNKKYFRIPIKNKNNNLNNKKVYLGHTKNVMGNPINALFWLIKELKKKNVSLIKISGCQQDQPHPLFP